MAGLGTAMMAIDRHEAPVFYRHHWPCEAGHDDQLSVSASSCCGLLNEVRMIVVSGPSKSRLAISILRQRG